MTPFKITAISHGSGDGSNSKTQRIEHSVNGMRQRKEAFGIKLMCKRLTHGILNQISSEIHLIFVRWRTHHR